MRSILWGAVILGLVCPRGAGAAGDPPQGTLVDQTSVAGFEAALWPEMAARYKAGEFKNAIGTWPNVSPWDETFAAASKRNAERLDVNQRGTIVEKATGRPARGLYGIPFAIDPKDPNAGVKIAWNASTGSWPRRRRASTWRAKAPWRARTPTAGTGLTSRGRPCGR